MKTKIQLALILFLQLVQIDLLGQNFYEVIWKDVNQDILYTGLLIYYSDDDALMRVKYNNQQGIYIVAEFECKGKYITMNNGDQKYILDGIDAKVVYSSDGNMADKAYNADNFYFTKVTDQGFDKLYTIDDQYLQRSNRSSFLREVRSWKELDPKQFTSEYVYNFFNNDEYYYTALLKYNTPVEVPTGESTLHLILVSNTQVPDIRLSCAVDENTVINELENISQELKIGFSRKVISGIAFSKDAVETALEELQPLSNDIVIFVYSGHGFRWRNQNSAYPTMALKYLRTETLSQNNTMSLESVYHNIVAKGARLNIIIGDCCNSELGATNRNGLISLASRNMSQGSIQRLKSLFLDTRSNVIAAAARSGETSCGSSVDGGYFISSFFQSIDKEVSYLGGQTPTWRNIVTRAINSANYKTQNLSGCEPQNGIYAVN
ncbi:caspase family protein [Ohtaekwangia kribbensis]|uniref:Caspase family protein n=1 Tax=Ohtaekwangia kribbensis TaxID=688913 RepID=A0ABW3JYD5_9BACT